MPTDSGKPSMMDAILAGEKVRMHAGNRDKSVGDGVISQLDGKRYGNMKQYENHLKQNDCHIKDYSLKEKVSEKHQEKPTDRGTWT